MHQSKSPFIRFSTIYENVFILCTKINSCGTMSVPIGSRHPATETPDRGTREQGSRGWFFNSTGRSVPLQVRACQGTSEGSPDEVIMLGHAMCHSNSSSEKSPVAATPQITPAFINVYISWQTAGTFNMPTSYQ